MVNPVREPKFNIYGIPDWCNIKAIKMVVQSFDQGSRWLIIANHVARVIITPFYDNYWSVYWGFSGEDLHHIRFTSDQLQAAFGLTNEMGKTGKQLLEFHGGDSAEEGIYLRWGNFLNIPSVPADFETDAAVSIEIDPRMQDCIRCLLEKR